MSASPAPHTTNPAANTQGEGKRVHDAKPRPISSGPRHSSSRREKVSAQAPDGISSTMPVTDQMTNRVEDWATESPVSANSSAYTG